MTQKIITQTYDDLDETLMQDGETVKFSFRGRHYEIDLSSEHVEEFEHAIAPYVRAGRAMRSNSTPAVDRTDTKAIRKWAQANGVQVNERGRIPGDVVAAYHNSAS